MQSSARLCHAAASSRSPQISPAVQAGANRPRYQVCQIWIIEFIRLHPSPHVLPVPANARPADPNRQRDARWSKLRNPDVPHWHSTRRIRCASRPNSLSGSHAPKRQPVSRCGCRPNDEPPHARSRGIRPRGYKVKSQRVRGRHRPSAVAALFFLETFRGSPCAATAGEVLVGRPQQAQQVADCETEFLVAVLVEEGGHLRYRGVIKLPNQGDDVTNHVLGLSAGLP